MAFPVAPDLVHEAPRRFVLVTGAGRSGTSTAAGALNLLGLHVPPPYLGANRSNPRGFFESKWSVQFHNQLMRKAYVAVVDTRPGSVQQVMAAVTPKHRARLRAWLEEASGYAPQLAVKDPRSAWTIALWADTVSDLGLEPGYLTMLRHPAEVVGSRQTYYASREGQHDTRTFATRNLAGWVNSNLITERQTRGRPRVFVPYDELLNDWRAAMSSVRETFDLTFNADLSTRQPHRVDEFVDPSLQRHPLTWDDVDVPEPLRDIAGGVWDASVRLAANGGTDAGAEAALDEAGERYVALCDDALALSHDAVTAAARRAGDDSARQVRAEMRKKIKRVRAQAKAENAGPRPWTSRVAASIRRRPR